VVNVLIYLPVVYTCICTVVCMVYELYMYVCKVCMYTSKVCIYSVVSMHDM